MTNIIKGKDCSLEESINRFENFFDNVGVHPEVKSWLNPLPHVWSVHVKCKEFPLLFTNGKGSTKQAALASAYGEFVERYVTQYFYADYYWNIPKSKSNKLSWLHHPKEKWIDVSDEFPHSILSRSLERFYRQEGDVVLSMLLDRNMGHKGVCCVPYIRARDSKEVFIPQNIIANLYVSNGMSCGNSFNEARVQALSEILERGVKNRIISENITLPTIDKEFLTRFPKIEKGIEDLKSEGFEVLVKDASLGGKYPVVNITLLNKSDAGVYCAFGAHPIFEVALERTLTELLQGRSLDQLSGFKIPSNDNEEVAAPENLEEHFIDSAGVVGWKFLSAEADFPFVPWEECLTPPDTTEEQWKYLVDIVQRDQYEVYCCDYSYLGESVVRIIVPGLSEVYPLDDLYLSNNSETLPFYSLFFNIHRIEEDECYELIRLLDSMALSSVEMLSDRFGLLFPEGSFWSNLTIGEFRALLFIRTGEIDQAREELFMGQSEDLFWKGLLCHIDLGEYDLERVRDNFIHLFGERRLYEIEQIREGNMSVLPSFDFSLHENLLETLYKSH